MVKYLAIILLLSSCMSARRVPGTLDKLNSKFPAPVADWNAKNFPCILSANDTIITVDSIPYLVDCPTEEIPFVLGDEPEVPVKVITKTVTIKVPEKTITIIKYVEDSAKIKTYLIESEKVKQDCQTSIAASLKKSTKETKYKNIFLGISLALFLLVLFAIYLLIRKKK